MSLELRNGKKLRFWEYTWLGHGPLRDQFPNKKLKLLHSAGTMGTESEIRKQWQNCELDKVEWEGENYELDDLTTLLWMLEKVEREGEKQDNYLRQ